MSIGEERTVRKSIHSTFLCFISFHLFPFSQLVLQKSKVIILLDHTVVVFPWCLLSRSFKILLLSTGQLLRGWEFIFYLHGVIWILFAGATGADCTFPTL